MNHIFYINVRSIYHCSWQMVESNNELLICFPLSSTKNKSRLSVSGYLRDNFHVYCVDSNSLIILFFIFLYMYFEKAPFYNNICGFSIFIYFKNIILMSYRFCRPYSKTYCDLPAGKMSHLEYWPISIVTLLEPW